jgi:subfamily B ATP-binding cassette protein MsbA
MLTIPLMVMLYFIVRGLGSFMDTYYMGKIGHSVVRDFRSVLLKHILNLPASFYHQNHTSQLISKLNYDTGQISDTLSNGLPSVIRGILSTIAYVSVMFLINWRITCLLLFAGPLLMYYINQVSRRMRGHSTRIQNTIGDLTQVTKEITEGYPVIRIFAGEAYEQARIQQVTNDNYQQEIKMIRTTAISVPFMQLIGATAMAGLLYLAMLKPDHPWGTGLTAGEFGAMFLSMVQLMRPVKQIAIVNSVMQRGVAAATSIFKILVTLPEAETGSQSFPKPVLGQIEFKQVNFKYGKHFDRLQLDQISFLIQPGQTVALVGESGAGKTTLANVLARFYPIESGEILIDHIPIQTLSLASLRSQFAMVSQNILLFDGTIRDNIAYGCNQQASEQAIRQAAKQAYALEFIEKLPLGFETPIGENGLLLSGGQRQRLAIARAILKNAPILILDEATSALDSKSEAYIQSALEQLSRNRTTLVIAHRLSTIERADLILVLSKGRLIESGRFSDLLNQENSLFKQLYRQFQEPEVKTLQTIQEIQEI